MVTIEGINMVELNPVQQAMKDESATQCGFCTPGFVMSLAGFCLSDKEPSYNNAIAAIDGNICRCTGYKSIERAASKVATIMQQRSGEEPTIFVVKEKILPEYFSGIKERLQSLQALAFNPKPSAFFVGGGTDLYVQKHEEMIHAPVDFLFDKQELNGIQQEGSKCIIGAAATVTDLAESALMQQYFPHLQRYIKWISSTPIRNIATIAGNFVNASPIGDFTIFFLALDATILLSDGTSKRTIPLRKFYKGYKQLDKQPTEFIEQIHFDLPTPNTKFNFEKVCKRTHLDIASVNTAINLNVMENVIVEAGISAGGVGPVPTYLQKTSDFLKGKKISEALVHDAIGIAQTEISPISDARGTEAYKRLLLGQLIKAHFIELFPELRMEELMKA
ncbi:MAG: FAD binding domain-containing protein [Chitinophagaceae bacterium]|nr:FAD binding domain-containing protein [Chitinophagaceae bacterium]